MSKAKPYPLDRVSRRIYYKFQTHDVKLYLFEDIVRRARAAVTHAGGNLLGGVASPPKHIKRWCVNRSPHVNKTSREHFWMVTHRRIFRWDASPEVPREAPREIVAMLPPTIAARITEDFPALMKLRDVWDTMHKSDHPGAGLSGLTLEDTPLATAQKKSLQS